ncbi:unnamed protein product [Brachionus calyciflorus]|uniref:Protein kinase domain-containing protein n=1 Tax=Brachionus calyciflorus TaxID=104777 RepID=A0A814F444_9BILA|nr:unnamed protein product [Brachionus calyciflorus]
MIILFFEFIIIDLKFLSDENLKSPIEYIFKLMCRIGIKKKKQHVTLKEIPIESDLFDIVKEISILQQCDSDNIVKYFGSYFKESYLWICMKYCPAGSVSDLM